MASSWKILGSSTCKNLSQKLLTSTGLCGRPAVVALTHIFNIKFRHLFSTHPRFVNKIKLGALTTKDVPPAKSFYGFPNVYNQFSSTSGRLYRKWNRLLNTPPTTLVIEPFEIINKPEFDEVYIPMIMVLAETVKVSVLNDNTNTTTVFVEGVGRDDFASANHGYKNVNCWIDLPNDHVFNIRDIKAEMPGYGYLRLDFPKWKHGEDDERNKLDREEQVTSRNVKVDYNSQTYEVKIHVHGKCRCSECAPNDNGI